MRRIFEEFEGLGSVFFVSVADWIINSLIQLILRDSLPFINVVELDKVKRFNLATV